MKGAQTEHTGLPKEGKEKEEDPYLGGSLHAVPVMAVVLPGIPGGRCGRMGSTSTMGAKITNSSGSRACAAWHRTMSISSF